MIKMANVQGSNELNMLLKAKVVKIKIELDYKGSNLPTQINTISKWLSDNDKRVKLKIKLDFSVKDISKQISDLHKTLNDSKTFKTEPIKIPIQIDVKGSATQIKSQLKEVMNTINTFNKKYAKQLQQLSSLQQQQQNQPRGNSLQSIPFSQYMKEIKDAENYMKGTFNKKGITGLFSTHELKDATGQVNGFIATLTRADGIVQKIRYQWDSTAGKFVPINRETVTQTERTAHQVKQVLTSMTSDIEKLKDGTSKTKLFSDQSALLSSKDLTMDMVKALQNRIKEEAVIQGQIKEENRTLLEQKKLLHDIKKSRDEEWKRTGDVDTRKQYNSLMNNTRSNSDSDFLKEQRFELQKINDEKAKEKKNEAETLAITKKRLQTQQELRNIERQTVIKDKTSQALIGEIKLMTQRARTAKDWLAIQSKMNNLKTSNANDREVQKAMNYAYKVEQVMLKLRDAGEMTEAKFDTNMKKISLLVQRGSSDIIREYEKMNRALQNVVDNNKRLASEGKNLTITNPNSVSKIQGAVNNNDIHMLQEYVGQLYKGKVETIKMDETIDKLGRSVTQLKVKMAGTGKQVETYTLQLNRANGELRETARGMDYNANRNLGVMEQLKIAMARVPVWMIAMTAFYGTLNSVKSMTSEILKLDTALTELRRVASDNLSIDYVFEGAVGLSKELGNNIHDVMQAVNDLARTFGDFNERQLLAISKTAILMSNVSDLTAQEATNNLVGTMNAFNISAEESIHIVDALNEVDNNYAISTKQLSEGLSKSASTAKTFGVTMEENVGHITAIGAVTMESGAIIGNSLKTIYSRLTTMDDAKTALQGVGIAMVDTSGDARDATEILDDLSKKWFEISDAERQNIAVKVAGRYQLSRFLALMNNYEMASKATTTAIHSEGSAMRENAEYMKSFEARINQLKNTWTELSSAIGEAILSDGLMMGINLLKTFAEWGIKVTESIGALPVALSAIGLVLLKFGAFNPFKNLILDLVKFGGVYKTVMANTAGAGLINRLRMVTTAWNGITVAENSAATGARNWGVALKGALIGTGIGILLVGIGIAIEKIVSKFAEAKRKQEELDNLNKKMVDGYRSYRDGMDSVVNRYDELSKKTKLSNEEQEEFNNLQKDLSEKIPTTVKYIDANGVAHMKTTAEIKKEIEAVKELSKAKAEEQMIKFDEKLQKQVKTYKEVNKEIKKLAEDRKKLEAEDGKEVTTTVGVGINSYETTAIKDNTKKIQENKVATLMAEAEKTEALQKTIKTLQSQTLAYFEANNKMDALGDKQQSSIESFLSMNEAMLRNSKDFEKTYTELYDIGQDIGNVFVDAYDVLSKDIDPSETLKLGKIKTQLDEVADAIPQTFYALTDESGKTVKSSEDVVSGLKEIVNVSQLVKTATKDSYSQLETQLVNAGLTANEANSYLQNLAIEHDNASLRAEAQAQSVNGLTEATENLNEAVIDAIDLTGTLFGYEKTDISSMLTHLQAMELLVDAHGDAVAKETDNYKASAQAVAEFLGVTATEVEQNFEKYKSVAEGLSEIDWSAKPDDQSLQDYIGTLENVDKATKDILIAYFDSGASADIFSGAVRNLTTEVDENTGAVAENANLIFDSNGRIIESYQAVSESVNSETEATKSATEKAKLAFEEMFYTLTNQSGEQVVFTNLINGATQVNGSLDEVKARYDEIQEHLDTPTGNQALDDLISKLTTTDGTLDGTRENILILQEILGNPAHAEFLDGAKQSLNETQEKVDKLKQEKIFNEQDESGTVVKEKVDKVKQTLDELNKSVYENKMKNIFNEQDESGTVVKEKVEKVSGAMDVVNKKMDEIRDKKLFGDDPLAGSSATQTKIDELTLAIQKASDSAQVLATLDSQVGNTARGVNDLLTQIKNITTGLSQVSTQASSLNSIKTAIQEVLLELLKAKQQLGEFLNSKEFGTFATSATQAFKVIKSAYESNNRDLGLMVSNMRNTMMPISIIFGIIASNSVREINSMTSKMREAFRVGLDYLVLQASLLPQRIGSAITANMQNVSKALKQLSDLVANTPIQVKVTSTGVGGGTSTKVGTKVVANSIDGDNAEDSRKSSGGQSYSGEGSFGTSSGEGGMSGGGDSGSSGTIVSNGSTIVSGSYDFNGDYGFHALATDDDTEIADLYEVDWNARILAGWENAISVLEAKMKNMSKNSKEYRDSLKEIVRLENSRLSALQSSLDAYESEKSSIASRLSELSDTSKHTKEQREEYNKLQQEYENLLSKINSINVEIQNSNNKIVETGKDVFLDWISEITLAYDNMINEFKSKVDNIEFAIEVAELVEPENVEKQLDLLAQKSSELQNQLSYEQGKKDDLSNRYNNAVSKYGKNSDQAKAVKEELEKAEEDWEDSTLAVLQNEKEIRDVRGEVADEGIDQLKDYYENMKDMAIEAIELEKEELEKAHEAKMEMYDDEVEKINSVYDAKIKAMDADKEQSDYEDELAEKNEKKAELMNKIALLSRDTTLEGRKKLAELQAELTDLNEEIADFQSERQDELLREQLEEQKNAQIDALNAQKENEELAYDEQIAGLDKDKVEAEKYYNDILNDDEYWAEMRSKFISGNFEQLTGELQSMSDNLALMNQGNFDMISESFAYFSDSVKKQMADLYGLNVDNMAYAMSPALDSVEQVNNTGYGFTNGNVNSKMVTYDEFVDPATVVATPTPAVETQPTPVTQPAPAPAPEPRYHTIVKGDTLWDLAKSYYGNPYKWQTIAQANGSPDPRKLQIGRKLLIPFRTGGYTGDWTGDEGKLAVLHKKELVLNQRQTSDILNTAKIMDKIKGIIPDVKKSSIADKLAMAGAITNISSMGDINVTVEGGDKKKAKDIATEILTGLKKKGK